MPPNCYRSAVSLLHAVLALPVAAGALLCGIVNREQHGSEFNRLALYISANCHNIQSSLLSQDRTDN